jgi:uncharacterized membrane protein
MHKSKRSSVRTLTLTLFLAALTVIAAWGQRTPASHSRTGAQPGEAQPGVQKSMPSSAAVRDSSPAFTYTFGLVDFPRSNSVGAFGINDHGQIVGGYNDVNLMGYPTDHALQLRGNKFSSFDFPGAAQTAAYGIDKSGQIVGVFVDSSGYYHGFKLVKSTYTQLDCPGVSGNTVPLAISNAGDIVGRCGDSSGFLLSGGVYTMITVPGAVYTYAEGINKAGVIVGYYIDGNGNSHGYVDNGGSVTTVDYPGYPNTYLDSINDSGLILGGYGSNTVIGSTTYLWTHGFLYSQGNFSTFDVPFGAVQATEPYALNNKGEIVGGYVDSQGMTYGFYAKATP